MSLSTLITPVAFLRWRATCFILLIYFFCYYSNYALAYIQTWEDKHFYSIVESKSLQKWRGET